MPLSGRAVAITPATSPSLISRMRAPALRTAAISSWCRGRSSIRTTSSEIGNLGSSQQNVRVYRIDGAVELIAESDQGGADVYTPGLVELPAAVTAGTTWSSEGTVGSRRYRSELRAAAAEPGCLRVSGTVVETTATGGPAAARTTRRRSRCG